MTVRVYRPCRRLRCARHSWFLRCGGVGCCLVWRPFVVESLSCAGRASGIVSSDRIVVLCCVVREWVRLGVVHGVVGGIGSVCSAVACLCCGCVLLLRRRMCVASVAVCGRVACWWGCLWLSKYF